MIGLVVGIVCGCLLFLLPLLWPVPPVVSGVLLASVSLTAIHGVAWGVLALARHQPTSRPRLIVAGVLLAGALYFLTFLFEAGRDRVRVGSGARSSQDVPASRGAHRLRVVNFNVLHGWPGFRDLEVRVDALTRALRALDADIVTLQEAWRVRGHGDLVVRLAEALGYDHAYARANGSLSRLGFEEGCAVLSRQPILDAHRLVLGPPRRWWESRIALVVTLDLGTGGRPPQEAIVVSTHLTPGRLEVAAEQARSLHARLTEPGPLVLVAGDFNAPSTSAAIEVFVRGGWRDLVVGGIDHVLLAPTSRWRVDRAAWTLRAEDNEQLIGEPVTISDHPGIVVDLISNRAQGSTPEGIEP